MQSILTRSAAILAAAILILLSPSCLHDDISSRTGENEVMVTFSFKLPTGPSAMRALTGDEITKVESVEVLAFKGGKYSYTAYSEAVNLSSGNTYTAEISLSVSVDNNDKYDLVVFANSRAAIAEAVPQFTKATSKMDALASLTQTVEGKWRAMDNADKDHLPMSSDPESGNLKDLVIGETTNTISGIGLHRALASVNVELTQKGNVSASDKFTLTSVRVYNRNKQGNLIGKHNINSEYTKAPNAIGSSRTLAPLIYGSDTGLQTSEIANGESCKNEIFLFEVEQIGLTDDTRPCIVIGGLYDGSSTPTYYRADFHNGTDYLDILRNHSYNFQITAINIPGYTTPEDAFNARSLDIEYNVVAWNDAQLNNIVTDGLYKLGVSAPTLDFDAYARGQNNSDNVITVFSDYETNGTIAVNFTENNNNWLSLEAVQNEGDYNNGTITLKGNEAQLRLLFDDNGSGAGIRTAAFTLTASRISYKVTVTQSNVRSVEPTIIAYNTSNIRGLDGQEYSFDVYHTVPFNISVAAHDEDKIEIATSPSVGGVSGEAKTTTITVKTYEYPTSTGFVDIPFTFESADPKVLYTQTYSSRVATPKAEPMANSYIVSPKSLDAIYIPISQLYRAMNYNNSQYGSAPVGAVLPSDWAASDTKFSSELVWQDNTISNLSLTTSVVGGRGPGAYIKVSLSEVPVEGGNAVVGVKNYEATGDEGFLWSWHVWIVDYTPPTLGTTPGRTLMNLNLGATNTTPGDTGSLGFFYQWGRKDPFPSPKTISPSGTDYKTIYGANDAVISATTTSPGNLELSIKNPKNFYNNSSNNNDWYAADTRNDNLWSTTKTVYDPCPHGWRVPGYGEYTNGETTNIGVNGDQTVPVVDTGWEWDSSNLGYNTIAASYSFGTGMWFPAVGSRNYNNSTLNAVGVGGHYWCASISTENSAQSRLFYFSNDRVRPGNSNGRAMGFSVRCVKE